MIKNEIPFLVGKSIFLRPLKESDINGPYPAWLNDAEVCGGNSHHIFPFRTQNAVTYIEKAHGDLNHLLLAVVRNKDGEHIGNIALDKINYINRSAELTILIGDKSCWNKGYGKEAARLICDHGFFTLNLHRISCGTFENNTAMCSLAEYLGMTEEGRRREAAYKDGRYLGVVEYGVLKPEYLKKIG